jgi:hypothetical protein
VQEEQLEEPAVARKEPAMQFEHTVAAATEYEPAAQTPVTADRPVVEQYDPARHDEQLEEPVVDKK